MLLSIQIRLKLGHWSIVVIFIVVVLLYDDSIQIFFKFIQTLVRAIASIAHSFLIGCAMGVQWCKNLVPFS